MLVRLSLGNLLVVVLEIQLVKTMEHVLELLVGVKVGLVVELLLGEF